MRIGTRDVGPDAPVFVIAEIGVNHNGSLDMARRLIEAAVGAGADAVKFQTFTAATLTTRAAPKAAYQIAGPDDDGRQFEMLRSLELEADDHAALMAAARRAGVEFLSTPFDEASADLLDGMGVRAFKVGSGDLTNLPLLEHIAAKSRPMIVSTGMATLGEVEAALQAIAAAGDPPVALLHCVSCYPADPATVNLRAMATLRQAFDRPVGWSDHTEGAAVSWAAVALGACIVEKHLTLDRDLPGPDHRASMEPAEFRDFVAGIRTVQGALGDGRKGPTPEERETAAVARRSLVAVVDIGPGEAIAPAMLGLRRPGTGLPAAMRPHVLGRPTRQVIPAGTVIELGMLA